MAWSDKFHSPIIIPGKRKPLETILDAARYITSLPESERAKDHWAPAATLLKLVGEGPPGGDQFMAQLAVQFGLRKGERSEMPTEPRRKPVRAYRILK
jgi:hypothetical protein